MSSDEEREKHYRHWNNLPPEEQQRFMGWYEVHKRAAEEEQLHSRENLLCEVAHRDMVIRDLIDNLNEARMKLRDYDPATVVLRRIHMGAQHPLPTQTQPKEEE